MSTLKAIFFTIVTLVLIGIVIAIIAALFAIWYIVVGAIVLAVIFLFLRTIFEISKEE